MTFSRTIIPAGRAILTRASANTLPRRFAAQSLRRYASIGDSQPPRPPLDKVKERVELANRLKHDPWVKDATSNFSLHPPGLQPLGGVFPIHKSTGFNFHTGRQPSKVQMMKLMIDKDFRQAMLKLAEAMQQAGVDGSSPQIQEIMKRMGLGQ
ncbi:hypothetical protein M0657_011121 [Pyricularia oryzae]|nr:hypothetical protein M0657_011121 [Pyricularia oryzae]